MTVNCYLSLVQGVCPRVPYILVVSLPNYESEGHRFDSCEEALGFLFEYPQRKLSVPFAS